MEIKLNVTRQQAEEVLHARLEAGAVEISPSALLATLNHIRDEKTAAIDIQDFDGAAGWRDNEKNIIAASAGIGLAQPEENVKNPRFRAI